MNDAGHLNQIEEDLRDAPEEMIIYLEPPLPTASSDLTRERKRAVHSSPIQSCSRWGLHGQPVT